jgi:ferric-chelate reductase
MITLLTAFLVLSATALVFVFITKFRATASFLAHTPLALYMYSDSHELHVYCGWTIVVFSMIHTVFHIARWAQQGTLYLLIDHFSGISGLFIILSCLLICIPMTIFRQQIRYEIRKNLHYLFIVFAGALMFHTPTSAIPNGGFTAYVFGTLLVWYFLDALCCYFFMTEKINTTNFSVLPSGVRMTMNVSERFQKMGAQGGICYVCFPWVAKNQWHAFSLFESPSNPAERQIFIHTSGDWTTEVHRILERDTVRPAWVQGPFPSPFDNADAYDNQILVASGIGITPALSVIRAHKDSRRINLIWAVREPHLIDFFLRHLYFDHQGWNLLFYTGKQKLEGSNIDILKNTNICIIEGRPKLNEIIPNIIYGIESGVGLPEKYIPDHRAAACEILADRLIKGESAKDLSLYASELGFILPTEEVSEEFASSDDLGSRRRARRRASVSILGHLTIGFRPWDRHDRAKEYVRRLDKKLVIQTWGILYCGGARPVLNELEKISDEYQLCLHVESFAW